MREQRVVVTGLGVVTPIGIGVPEFWEALNESPDAMAMDTQDFCDFWDGQPSSLKRLHLGHCYYLLHLYSRGVPLVTPQVGDDTHMSQYHPHFPLLGAFKLVWTQTKLARLISRVVIKHKKLSGALLLFWLHINRFRAIQRSIFDSWADISYA
jgi:3-oxoacyl-(acyl-carrier-protein) synthase